MGGAMPTAHETILAATLAALLRDRRVSVAHVARAGGLARNTVAYILTGKTRHPPTATLRRVARGVATDPGTGELDREVMTKAERLLAIGAGYADPAGRDAESLLELAFFSSLNSRERARAWMATFERYKGLDAEEVLRLGYAPDAAP